MDYNDWKEWWKETFEDKQRNDIYANYYYTLSSMPKNYNWTIEPAKPKVTLQDKLNLENTYKNDMVYKNSLQSLMDEIDGALRVEDRDWFERASKEYTALKMECV